MEKQTYRNQIDKIDAQLIRLFSERMAVAGEIAAYKKEQGLPVLDVRREREKLNDVIAQTPQELKDYTPLLFSLLFEMSRSYQNRLIGTGGALQERLQTALEQTPKLFPQTASVACQGIEGANAQLACDRLFQNANTMYCASFEAVFSAIEAGLCRYGVVPVENSSAGSVNSVYDLMMRHKFHIVRSVRMKIEHNLLANHGTSIENIREIYSHEQAISQCADYLSTLKNVRVIPCENTAVAARLVAQSGRTDVAALASRACMQLYGLSCLCQSVQNTDNNYTRFICISKDLEIYPGADRTSLMLTLPHRQGSLYRLLSKLYALGINLNKLESRPLPNREFEFMFYFDLDTPVYSPQLLQLLGELPEACECFTYLGSYSEVF